MGMKLKGLQGSKANGDINVTPLIDVVLVLLIIFMVLTPIIIEEMAVNLPSDIEAPKPKEPPKDQVLVAVCADGTFSLNRVSMPLSELAEQVSRKLKRKGSQPKVAFIDSHPDAPYDQVVLLMDTVRDAGAEKVGIAELKEPGDFLACTPKDDATP